VLVLLLLLLLLHLALPTVVVPPLILDVMDQCLQIVRRNQKIIHSQRDKLLQEFPDIPVFLPIPDPYGSLTPVELAAFGIGPARVSSDDDDEVQANDDEVMEDDE
jgi:hypothetical protein